MQLNHAVGTLTRIGDASAFVNDFVQYQGQNLPGTKWALWPNVGPLMHLQNLIMDQHGAALAKAQRIRENADLTTVAKARQSLDAYTLFADAAKAALPSIAETATNLHTFASTQLLPVQPLSSTDAAGAAMDAECRAYVYDLNSKDRSDLMAEMRQGREQRITAAILRGPARLSGFSNQQLIQLSAAGIAVHHADAVLTLGRLAGGMRDLLHMVQTLGNDVIRPGVELDSKTAEIGSLTKVSQGLVDLIEWLKPIPLELPSNTPLPPETAERMKQQTSVEAV